jgi:hypothetical protein
LTINIHLKNKGQECKIGPVRRWALVEEGRVNGEGEGGRIWSMPFIYLCENRMMKPAEIILSKRKGDEVE